MRVTNLYATPWHLADGTGGHELPRFLDLGRLEHRYRLSADQLPRVLCRETLDAGAVTFQRWHPVDAVAGGMGLVLPAAVGTVGGRADRRCALRAGRGDRPARRLLLRGCVCRGNARSSSTRRQWRSNWAREATLRPVSFRSGTRSCSALTLCPRTVEDLVQRLIYRADLPYRKDYSAIRYPAELNRRPGWLVAVGPYVSVVCGQQNYVENAIFPSAVQGVGAAAQLRAIRQAAYADVRLFRYFEGTRALPGTAGGSWSDRRSAGDLELELSYSVEASADLGLLVPSLRTESFHNALYESIGLARKAATAERMLERLGARDQRGTDRDREHRAAGRREPARPLRRRGRVRLRGRDPGQPDPDVPGHQRQPGQPGPVHVQRALPGHVPHRRRLIVIGVALSLGLWMQHRRDARHHRVRRERQRWPLVADEPIINAGHPIQPRRWAAAPAANRLETPSRFMMAAM